MPPLHVSPVVQTLPSLQGAVLLTCWQPPIGSHESFVHGFPSSQLTAVPGWHVPPPQTSPFVQTLPSLHGAVLFAC